MREVNKITFTDPYVNKEVKVQKDGSIHLSLPLAGERVKVVAEPVNPDTEIDKQTVAGVAELLQEAIEQDDADSRDQMLRQALVALDQQAEQ